jgi:membrane-associated protein
MSSLTQLAVSSPLSYLAAFWLPALDAVVPIVPSETVLIALGVATVGSADPRIAILLALAAFGAFAGDNLAYLIGRRFGPVAERKLFAGERGIRRREWAQRTLGRFGAGLIIVCRFIPGGRTAVTVTCGVVGYRRKTFVLATAFAAVIWVTYAYSLGRVGGAAFKDRPWVAFLVALGAAAVITGFVEGVRRIRSMRSRRQDGSAPTAGSPAHSATMTASAVQSASMPTDSIRVASGAGDGSD